MISNEKQRAANIIWNAAQDYSFQPESGAFDRNGKADLYWNYILGAVRRYYDYPQIEAFFHALKRGRDYEFYESLTWIGLENACYEKGRTERPILQDLRQGYAQKFLANGFEPAFYYLVGEIKKAHFQHVLGQEPPMREQVAVILTDLQFDGAMDTDQIIARMTEIIDTYFVFSSSKIKKSPFDFLDRLLLGGQHFSGGRNEFRLVRRFFLKQFKNDDSGAAEGIQPVAKNNGLDTKKSWWINFSGQIKEIKRDEIQNLFGRSILSESQTSAIEQILCVGNHQNCRLHFTRGEFDPAETGKKNGADPKNKVFKQRKSNQSYYQKNLARNHTSITRLTDKIKNTLLLNLETTFVRSESGRLATGKIWRTCYLDDSRVFLKEQKNEIGSLSVDLLLDASGSQQNRQEIIATEAYIIAESLTRCQIPVSVYSFCTRNVYTVINLLRDYDESGKNERIFNYHASGCNRDGLAVRTAIHRMKKTPSEHKLLIILSDGKPLDPQGIAGNGYNPDEFAYADSLGVNDVAAEVNQGRQQGIPIICIFTGLDEDLPAAKKIYGHNLARIHSPEKFADVVGVLIRNMLNSL